MGNFTASTVGKEQLILLPFEEDTYKLHTDSSITLEMRTGLHCAVISGYAEFTAMDFGQPWEQFDSNQSMFFLDGISEDEDLTKQEVKLVVGPDWRDLVQVSADVSRAGIVSSDSDEVDRSYWVVRDCTWRAAVINGLEKIELTIQLETKGDLNGWTNLGYQVVATGNLARMPTPDEISAILPPP